MSRTIPVHAYKAYIHKLPHLYFSCGTKLFPDEPCNACDNASTTCLNECTTCPLRLCDACKTVILDPCCWGDLEVLVGLVAPWKLRQPGDSDKLAEGDKRTIMKFREVLDKIGLEVAETEALAKRHG